MIEGGGGEGIDEKERDFRSRTLKVRDEYRK